MTRGALVRFTSSPMSTLDFDLAVIGSGAEGLAVACGVRAA